MEMRALSPPDVAAEKTATAACEEAFHVHCGPAAPFVHAAVHWTPVVLTGYSCKSDGAHDRLGGFVTSSQGFATQVRGVVLPARATDSSKSDVGIAARSTTVPLALSVQSYVGAGVGTTPGGSGVGSGVGTGVGAGDGTGVGTGVGGSGVGAEHRTEDCRRMRIVSTPSGAVVSGNDDSTGWKAASATSHTTDTLTTRVKLCAVVVKVVTAAYVDASHVQMVGPGGCVYDAAHLCVAAV